MNQDFQALDSVRENPGMREGYLGVVVANGVGVFVAKGMDRLEALEVYPTYWLGNQEMPFCKTGSDFRIGLYAHP